MTFPDPSANGAHHIRLAGRSTGMPGLSGTIAALRDYLEQCDARSIASNSYLHLSAADRLTRDDIVTALPLCVNIIRAGTTLVLASGETFGRDDINASLSLKLVLALATLDETHDRQPPIRDCA